MNYLIETLSPSGRRYFKSPDLSRCEWWAPEKSEAHQIKTPQEAEEIARYLSELGRPKWASTGGVLVVELNGSVCRIKSIFNFR